MRPGVIRLTYGSAPEEALSLGCEFQLFSYAWVPKKCTQPGIEAEFRALPGLRYYSTSDGSQEVDVTEVAKGESHLWTNIVEHDVHCELVLRSLAMASLSGVYTGNILDLEHSNHCIDSLLTAKNWSMDELNTQVEVDFLSCTVLRTPIIYNVVYKRVTRTSE
ncbi:hypothetical protein COCVIDRAFT_117381 [Bipolaris victoriae FI3]|uniref:Uncharacterized protein n=1 Tax=Bipolaris victoriae (strain FI3) TaxID=930091 RepID=W7E8K0_BIPV3|nr:hypothetical protein COCVIDRAFT_117381 [Bipolaris victoriae FI3]